MDICGKATPLFVSKNILIDVCYCKITLFYGTTQTDVSFLTFHTMQAKPQLAIAKTDKYKPRCGKKQSAHLQQCLFSYSEMMPLLHKQGGVAKVWAEAMKHG